MHFECGAGRPGVSIFYLVDHAFDVRPNRDRNARIRNDRIDSLQMNEITVTRRFQMD